jgi:hypothetical protein
MQIIHDSSLVLETNLKSFLYKTQAIWLPILYALTLLLLSPIHNIFFEWGGVMQYFAGKDIFSGVGYHGWVAGFWPPLYSFLIGFGSLVMPGFLAGKLVTILASSILLFVTYHLAYELTNSNEIGLWSQIFLGLSPLYFNQSFTAHNHIINSLFFISGLFIFIRSVNRSKGLLFLVSGVVCGIAGLSRYTSYSLIFLPFLLFFLIPDLKKSIQFSLIFWSGFIIASLPWWYYNAINNGSPLSNWEYLNVCSAVVPGNLYAAFTSLWECRSQSNLNSIFSIVSSYPVDYLKNFVKNIPESIKLLVIYGGVLAPFVIPALFDSVFYRIRKGWFIAFSVILFLILTVSQASVQDWYILSSMPIVIIASTLFLFNYLSRLLEAYPILKKFVHLYYVLGSLTIIALALVIVQILGFRNEPLDGFTDLDQIVQVVRKNDPRIQSKVVMATDPAWAYYLGSKYLSTPAVYDGPIEGLVSYQGVSDSLKAYAPKYPSNMSNSEMRADYLIYKKQPPTWSNTADLPQFSFLLDPSSDKIPGNFKLVFSSLNTVVYQIRWP